MNSIHISCISCLIQLCSLQTSGSSNPHLVIKHIKERNDLPLSEAGQLKPYLGNINKIQKITGSLEGNSNFKSLIPINHKVFSIRRTRRALVRPRKMTFLKRYHRRFYHTIFSYFADLLDNTFTILITKLTYYLTNNVIKMSKSVHKPNTHNPITNTTKQTYNVT